MKVLLVGNLAEDRQESMRRFTDLLYAGLQRIGYDAEQIAPTLRLARLVKPYRYSGLPKYLGYFDKFVLFPRRLRQYLAHEKPDVVHITDHSNAVYLPATQPTPTLVTSHDFLQIRAARGEIAQQPVGLPGKIYQAWILNHLSRSRRIACVSRKTQIDAIRLTDLDVSRLPVVPNALNYPYDRLTPSVATSRLRPLAAKAGIDAERLSEPGGFVLHVGAAHWYKNRGGLLGIYAALREKISPPPALVMVGPPLEGADLEKAKSLGILPHVISFSGVSSEQLEAFYTLAECLIFPSWEEGFGWPIAEAQACGCPVFTTDRAPMTEVGGRFAGYFNPAEHALAARIIASRWGDRSQMRSDALEHRDRWKVDTMLWAYLRIYTELVEERREEIEYEKQL